MERQTRFDLAAEMAMKISGHCQTEEEMEEVLLLVKKMLALRPLLSQ